LGPGGPLSYFLSSGCFSCKNIHARKILDQVEFQKVIKQRLSNPRKILGQFKFQKVIRQARRGKKRLGASPRHAPSLSFPLPMNFSTTPFSHAVCIFFFAYGVKTFWSSRMAVIISSNKGNNRFPLIF
jgi:hypothetical protein